MVRQQLELALRVEAQEVTPENLEEQLDHARLPSRRLEGHAGRVVMVIAPP